MRGRSRVATLVLAAALLVGCGGGRSTWAFPTGVEARPNPCKTAVTRLAGFTGRLVDNFVSLRALLVAEDFDPAETARGIKSVAATLTAYPEMQGVAQGCEATADLTVRTAALETSAAAAVRPSLAAAPISEGEVHWLAAFRLLELLPEALTISTAAKEAGDRLDIEVTAAVDPAGSSPPEIPLGPYVAATPAYREFAERVLRRGAEFGVLVDDELASLAAGGGETRRVGHRLVTFSDTEIKWLKGHQPEPCYRQFWRAVMADWYDIKNAGAKIVDVAPDSAMKSLKKARNHLTTLMDRDYISEANALCVTSPAGAP